MSKHTQAPWRQEKQEGFQHCIISKDNKTIAIAKTLEDARLIAAAPDMLEALKKAHRMLTRDYIDDAKMAVIDMVDAAIEKATGKQCP